MCLEDINIANQLMQFFSLLAIICLLAILQFCKYLFLIASRTEVFIFLSYRRCMLKCTGNNGGDAHNQFNCRLFGVDFFPLFTWQVKSNLANVLSGIGVKRYYIHGI